ncbi:polynucleotide 3'-phosphatase [Aspergillus alliaceus]|uniref:tripeptidyl-peptidase II n=1 Tax=Petromyces alliaceus TaxID=209559 RepID=A0A5N6G4F1_PETAA|nr:peptidase S8/S53 domain-containing protein [Aspergillus alliaceus]KAB8237172.1 peptidase S8/S53 domain-containing protein [Aspergillus alliaceus]KAF5857295.1 polynucleotide 3'-phosphatase [Aspergillus burnettii]
MWSSLLSRPALSLAVLSLLSSSAAGEVFEKLSAVPKGWHYSNTPSGDTPIALKIALQQHDVAGFEKALLEMSDPDHPSYGKHFKTHDEMKRMLLPTDTAVDAVREWLGSAGISDVDQDADWINFRTTVDKANALLDADFKWYVSQAKPIRRLRTLQYSIPDSVASHVNVIQPTTRFGKISPNGAILHSKPSQIDETALTSAILSKDSSHCDSVITPTCLKELYNIGDYKPDPRKGSKIAFASYLEEYARYSDLAKFEKNIAPWASGLNFSVTLYNGGLNDQNAASDSGEANLDLQYIVGISAPLPVTEFSTGGRGPLIPDLTQPDPNKSSNEPYLEFFQNVLKLNDKDLPQVISTSYGENEQEIPEKYARTVCNLIAQLGSRGVSVLFSSGDSGVGAGCMTNDGKNTTHFPPQFPASCPWVTSVGATYKTNPEVAVYFSSGGFSDYWGRPEWQDEAVSSFLEANGDKWDGLYNASGRAFPDVSAQGVNYAVYDKGVLGQFDGTSASAPTFSGIVALLNDARLRAGKPTLGFLNPWLYKAGRDGLNDIVHGGSKGCDGHSRFGGAPDGGPVIPFASWNATKGWDPVTGLGTPDFGKLVKLAVGN